MTLSTERRRFTAIAAVAALFGTLVLSACGSSAAATGDSKDSFTFALASDPTCINPRVAGNNDAAYPSRQLVDSLTDQDPKTGEIVPWLAKSWEVSDDATTFTFHLEDGVTFSDGTKLDANSIKANFDEVIKYGAAQSASLQFLSGYAQTVVVDPLTARVEFSKPNAQFLQATASHFLGILAPSTLAIDPAQRCEAGIVGSGPFVLDHYTKNTEVVEHRRDDYKWGSSLWENQGAAKVRTLTFKVIPESGVRSGALKSGQVDAIGGVAPQDEKSLNSGNFTLQSRPNPGLVFSLLLNVKQPGLDDPEVRKALMKAIDRKSIVAAVLSPSFKPATSIIAANTPGAEDLSKTITYEPGAAKKLLDAAGWVEGSDGIREKGGVKLQFKLIWPPVFNPNQASVELVQQQLAKIGVGVDLNEVPVSQSRAVLNSGDFDLYWANSSRPDPDILRTSFWADGTSPYGVEDPALIEAFNGLQSTTDQVKRGEFAKTAQQILVDEAYAVPVYELTTVLGLSKKVSDLRFDSYSRLQFHDVTVTE